MTVPLFESEVTEYQRPDGVTVIKRRPFARDHFPYEPGEHVVFGGPTTRGKTTLAFQLMEYVCNPTHPAYVVVSKPRDPTTQRWGGLLGYRRVDHWPPVRKFGEMPAFGGQPPSGYLIWPQFGEIDKDMARAAELTDKVLRTQYSRGVSPKSTGGVLVMDDTMVKAKIQGNDEMMVVILAMAGAMDLGMWVFVQKPTDSGRTTVWAYEQATHLFFTKGGDERMLNRYREIIGERGLMAKHIIPTLGEYQFLYVHRVKGYMCIVDAD